MCRIWRKVSGKQRVRGSDPGSGETHSPVQSVDAGKKEFSFKVNHRNKMWYSGSRSPPQPGLWSQSGRCRHSQLGEMWGTDAGGTGSTRTRFFTRSFFHSEQLRVRHRGADFTFNYKRNILSFILFYSTFWRFFAASYNIDLNRFMHLQQLFYNRLIKKENIEAETPKILKICCFSSTCVDNKQNIFSQCFDLL